MTQIQDVLFALQAKVKEALPTTIVKVNEPLAEGFVTPGRRYVELAVGEPDDGFPQPLLGGVWIHRRVIEAVVSTAGADDDDRTKELFGMVKAIEAKLMEDRRMGGLATTVDLSPPSYDHGPGNADSSPIGSAALGIVVEYESTSMVE